MSRSPGFVADIVPARRVLWRISSVAGAVVAAVLIASCTSSGRSSAPQSHSSQTAVPTFPSSAPSTPSPTLSPWPATSSSWRSGVCQAAQALVGVFFLPSSATGPIDAAETASMADPNVGLVGFIDQAAGYQEFETLFRGTSSENKLSQQQIPPSLRVFTDTTDVSALVAKLEALPGVLRVTTSISGEGSSAPELNPIAGLYDIGTVVYQRPGWKSSCVLRAWSLNHPALV